MNEKKKRKDYSFERAYRVGEVTLANEHGGEFATGKSELFSLLRPFWASSVERDTYCNSQMSREIKEKKENVLI